MGRPRKELKRKDLIGKKVKSRTKDDFWKCTKDNLDVDLEDIDDNECAEFVNMVLREQALKQDTADLESQESTWKLINNLPSQSQKKLKLPENTKIITYEQLSSLYRVLKVDGKVVVV